MFTVNILVNTMSKSQLHNDNILHVHILSID